MESLVFSASGVAGMQFAPVAQSDRASVYETEGHRFESCLAHHEKTRSCGSFFVDQETSQEVFRPWVPLMGTKREENVPFLWGSTRRARSSGARRDCHPSPWFEMTQCPRMRGQTSKVTEVFLGD